MVDKPLLDLTRAFSPKVELTPPYEIVFPDEKLPIVPVGGVPEYSRVTLKNPGL
jgi:hypothetical protein